MRLFDIQEPNILENENSASPVEAAIGIDLGTTNSLIAISKEHKPYIIAGEGDNGRLLPSIVSYQNNSSLVGNEALAHQNYISSIKRLIGKGLNDIKGLALPYIIHASSDEHLIRLDINGNIKTPIEISAEILKKLKTRAETHLNCSVKNAVITVPAYFDDAARVATKNAARLAGLNILRLINEPTAAALAYGLDRNESGIHAIYDLGGGTFDISILKFTKGVFKVLATGGNANLGGDDFDQRIVEHLSNSALTDNELKKALMEAREIKEYLTYHDSWSGNFLGKACAISIAEFNKLTQPFISETIKIFKQVLKDAEINLTDLKEIILVGGSTRIPSIKEAISNYFNITPLDSINPEEIVALGAALQAEALTFGSNNLLLDVTPLSLGIEVLGGISEVIIPRNSPLPIEQSMIYTTDKDGQTGFIIHVIQGEHQKVSECRSLARFELKGIPPLSAGQPRIEINFRIDVDGLLTVSAKEIITGSWQEVEISPSFGLTEEEVLKLILNGSTQKREQPEDI